MGPTDLNEEWFSPFILSNIAHYNDIVSLYEIYLFDIIWLWRVKIARAAMLVLKRLQENTLRSCIHNTMLISKTFLARWINRTNLCTRKLNLSMQNIHWKTQKCKSSKACSAIWKSRLFRKKMNSWSICWIKCRKKITVCQHRSWYSKKKVSAFNNSKAKYNSLFFILINYSWKTKDWQNRSPS